LHMEASIFGQP